MTTQYAEEEGQKAALLLILEKLFSEASDRADKFTDVYVTGGKYHRNRTLHEKVRAIEAVLNDVRNGMTLEDAAAKASATHWLLEEVTKRMRAVQ